MELIKYIFYLGITFMIFSMIWGFFMIVYRALTGMGERPAFETYIFRLLNMYFLVSLAAMQTVVYLNKPGAPHILITLTGLIILYSYLMGRLERSRFVMQFNQTRVTTQRVNTMWESIIVLTSLVYFSFVIRKPELLDNSANKWFFDSIHAIYITPVIGWIFKLIGVLLLIVNLFKSVFVTARIISWLLDRLSGGNGNGPFNDNNNNGNRNDGDYTDYEIVEDDKID